MKTKLLISILFALTFFYSVGQSVLNTTTFTLQNVVDAVNPTTGDLVDCFSDANAAYFNATYAGTKTNLLNFRDYGPHHGIKTISITGNSNHLSLNANPAVISITISSGTNLLIVAIHAVSSSSGTRGDTGTPTFNGVSMTEAGANAGSFPTEVWYITDPSIGTYNVSIPNSSTNNLQVSLSKFTYTGSLSVNSYSSASGTSTNPSATVTTLNNKRVVLMHAATIKTNYTNDIGVVSYTDTQLNGGVGGAAFGSLAQYNIQTSDGTNKTSSWTLDEAMRWYSVLINFTAN